MHILLITALFFYLFVSIILHCIFLSFFRMHVTTKYSIAESGLTDEIGRLSKHVETQKYALVEFKLANDELKKQTHERILTENAEKKNVTRSPKDKIKKKNNVAVSNDQIHSLPSVNNNNANNMNSYGNNGHGEVSDGTTNREIKKMTDDSRKLIDQLERDRDYYKDQWNKLNEKLDKASDTENVSIITVNIKRRKTFFKVQFCLMLFNY